ncbi:MAG TPA: hypothetical protein PLZ99_02020 [Parcubacteria group bacterium]|jgi:hypothetical protein|nr:hypothetical protein [Parcubacteria group bacterium]
MKFTISFFVLIIVVVLAVSKFSPAVYEVRFDYANGEVVEIRDETGKRVQKNLEDLKREGIMYEVVYVQPRTMGNN